MEAPDKQILRAFITSVDNPEAHVLHRTGTEPLEVGSITDGNESLLRVLGQRVLENGYLTIDYLLSRKDVADPIRNITLNVAEVQTKPIDRARINLSSEYKWSDH